VTPNKIINIAHRGYTRDFPDNTLEAFRAALELGVDGVEFDVQETADAEFMIHHDDSIGGTPIATMTAQQVADHLVAGRYRIPRLQEALKLLGKGLIFVVELKQVRSLEKFISILRANADVSRLVAVSFSRELIIRMSETAPDIMRAVITSTSSAAGSPGIAQSIGSTAIGMRCQDLDGAVIAKLHKDGTMVFVWDCSGAESLRTVIKYDIDGVISDVPDLVKAAAVNAD
jgi:glycerophosphoryl diester phosphodiesterase